MWKAFLELINSATLKISEREVSATGLATVLVFLSFVLVVLIK